jgi:hypothetical protein
MFMQFSSPITIQPPPYSDNNNKIINPQPIVLDTLNVTYCDSPSRKQYFATIERIPAPIFLLNATDYDKFPNLNKEFGEKKLLEILGDNPAKFLRSLFPKTIEENPNGPGAILSSMIKSLGIVMTQGCSCRRHAIEMNEKGNDWCEANIDTIVSWLREEATKRKLPFIDTVGKIMVKRAIKKSRRLLANQPVPENDEDLDSLDNT